MKTAFFERGYAGMVSAASLAQVGNEVAGIDAYPAKIGQLYSGGAPIYEHGLAGMLARSGEAGRFRFATDARLGVNVGTILFIALGTPPG